MISLGLFLKDPITGIYLRQADLVVHLKVSNQPTNQLVHNKPICSTSCVFSCLQPHEAHHFRKSQKNNFEGPAERLEKDADHRKCMQENSPTYETVESWEKVTCGPRETSKRRRSKGRCSLGTSGMFCKLQPEDPTRHQRGQAHRARMNINRCSGRPLAMQEVPPSKHSDHEVVLTPQNAIQNLAIRAGGVEQRTHF